MMISNAKFLSIYPFQFYFSQQFQWYTILKRLAPNGLENFTA